MLSTTNGEREKDFRKMTVLGRRCTENIFLLKDEKVFCYSQHYFNANEEILIFDLDKEVLLLLTNLTFANLYSVKVLGFIFSKVQLKVS